MLGKVNVVVFHSLKFKLWQRPALGDLENIQGTSAVRESKWNRAGRLTLGTDLSSRPPLEASGGGG